jgi:hypothetical protein
MKSVELFKNMSEIIVIFDKLEPEPHKTAAWSYAILIPSQFQAGLWIRIDLTPDPDTAF